MTTTERVRYASQGAVRQNGGSLPIRYCRTCHREIVWCESKRTGKSYPVNVTYGYNHNAFYIGANIHRCEDTATLKMVAVSYRAEVDAERSETVAVMREVMIAGVQAGLTDEQIDAAIKRRLGGES